MMFRLTIALALASVSLAAQTPSTGALDFRVFTAGNAPVAAASVTLEGPDGRTYSGATARDGHFRLANLTPGVYRFTAFDAPGYVRSPRNFLEDISIHPGHTREFQFELTPAPKVQGTLFDAEGKPVAGATLLAYSARRAELTGTAVTNAQGFYSMTLSSSLDSFLTRFALPALVVPGNIVRPSQDVTVERTSGVSGIAIEFELPMLPLAPNETVNLYLLPVTASIR